MIRLSQSTARDFVFHNSPPFYSPAGVVLSQVRRSFIAKQLLESLLMRRTIAQYKPCRAGRKARFFLPWGGAFLTGQGGVRLKTPIPVTHRSSTWHVHHAGLSFACRHGTEIKRLEQSVTYAESRLIISFHHHRHLMLTNLIIWFPFICGLIWNWIYPTSHHRIGAAIVSAETERTERIQSENGAGGGKGPERLWST